MTAELDPLERALADEFGTQAERRERDGFVARTFATPDGLRTLEVLERLTVFRPLRFNQRQEQEPVDEAHFMAYRAGQNDLVFSIRAAIERATKGV